MYNGFGDIEFVKYENDIVYVKMSGACADCGMLDITLQEGVLAAIQSEVPNVKEIVNLSELY